MCCNPDLIVDRTCRHCGAPMRVRLQITHYEKDGVVKLHREFNFVDCLNDDCPLFMQTFDDTQYADKDLSPYLTKAGVR